MPGGLGRFGRADRLLRGQEFRNVVRDGRRVAVGAFVVLGTMGEPGPERRGARLGVTVSRRVGGAVVRNRVKRRVREWFRWGRHRLPIELDLVVIGRAPAGALTGREVAGLLDEAARRLGALPS